MEEENKKIKIISPEKALDKFLHWFDSNKRLAFLLALLVGIITHITMITETIMSQDGLWNSMDYYRPGKWETSLGRWGIALIERLNYFIAIPTISTITCILIMAIAAVFIIDLFDFKSKISVIATSLVLVLTPTLTVTLLYIYTSVAYCFNFLISVLVIWFLYKFKYKKIGFVLSTFCFLFSLSIYQSYIGVSIGLCAMVTILDLLKNEKSVKEILLNVLKGISVVILGAILYYITTMIIFNVLNLELSNYKGTQSLSIKQILLNLPSNIIQTYRDFFTFFLGDTIIHNTNFRREIINGLFLILFGIITIIAIVKIEASDKRTQIIKRVLSSFCILVLPICLNVIVVLITGTVMYSLTTVQMILIIPLAFSIFEIIDGFQIIKWGAIIACIGILGTYYLTDNASYAALKLTYNQAYSTTIRIMDRVENTEGYVFGMPILFGGIVGDYNFVRTSSLYEFIAEPIVRNPVFHGTYSGAVGTWTKFIKVFLGLDIPSCSAEDYNRIVQSDEYKKMNNFPYGNSTKVIDGIMVVRLIDAPDLAY